MGRGRQKAKHTKVARELKYFSPDTDYSQLERELGAGPTSPVEDYDAEAWADYAAPVEATPDSAGNEASGAPLVGVTANEANGATVHTLRTLLEP